MPNKAPIKVPKTRKVKATRSAQYLTDLKHMGEEPDVAGKTLFGTELGHVFSWYNYMCSRTEAREYVENYLKSHKRQADLVAFRKVPDAYIDTVAAWQARIMMRGGSTGSDTAEKFSKRLADMLKHGNRKSVDTMSDSKPSIQNRISDKISNTIGELDELIDQEGWTIDVYEWLTQKQVPQAYAKHIAEFFKQTADEAVLLISKKAPNDLLEGYKSFNKTELKQRANFYTKLIADCARYADVVKKRRVVNRTKKPITAEKMLKTFKHQTESKEYKIASVKPEKILGCQELWTFNTRYKTLHVFYANGPAGLSVKGTTILGYDENKSRGFRIGRKTQEYLGMTLKGGVRNLSKIMALKPCTLQHRCNENTILIKADK